MKVLRWLDQYLEEALLLIMLCAMTLVMGVQVAARYVLGSSSFPGLSVPASASKKARR